VEDEERQLYEWLGTEHVPAQIVLTKVDKLSATERGLLRERCRKTFGGRAPILISGETGEGVPALWAAIFEAAARAPGSASAGPSVSRLHIGPSVGTQNARGSNGGIPPPASGAATRR